MRQMAADALLAQAVAACGVDQRDAHVERCVEQPCDVGFAERRVADLPGTQPERRDLQAAAAVGPSEAHPLTPPAVSPDTIHRCAARNTSVIGSPDNTAAAAKSPHRNFWSAR
jgi:hypothetical protein